MRSAETSLMVISAHTLNHMQKMHHNEGEREPTLLPTTSWALTQPKARQHSPTCTNNPSSEWPCGAPLPSLIHFCHKCNISISFSLCHNCSKKASINIALQPLNHPPKKEKGEVGTRMPRDVVIKSPALKYFLSLVSSLTVLSYFLAC